MNMTQIEMYNFLNENLTSHSIQIEGNKIVGKRLINSRSFASFRISFLKNGTYSIKASAGRTMNYSDVLDLFCFMGCLSYFKDHKDYKVLLGIAN